MNKIPANRTNVAMAEALSALNIVKGIEKYCKSTESSAAESSVESPGKNVVTSPKTIGRRKQVTATPVTRRKKRVSPVKTVQRVYNTRLSAKLLKKEKVDSEKKECLEALKFNSDCEVVSDCDLGEVLEDKSVPGCDNVGENSSVPEIKQQNMSVLWTNASEDLDLKESSATEMKSVPLQTSDDGFKSFKKPIDKDMVVLEVPFCEKKDDVGVGSSFSEIDAEVIPNQGSDYIRVDSSFYEVEQLRELDSNYTAAKNLKCKLLQNNDDAGIDLCNSETDDITEVMLNEVELLPKGTEKAEVEIPIQRAKGVEQVFSPKEKGPDEVGVHFSFSEGSDDVELHFYVLEADKNMDATVPFSTDSNERECMKEHLNMESCEKVDYGEGLYDLMIQPMSEKVMLECLSSGVVNSVDGENFDNSVKILEDISCNSESGAVYGDVKGLASQEEIRCQAIACGPPICSESSERLENSIHNNSDDDTSIDTEFFQHNAYSKHSDSSRKSSEIYSSDGAFKFADQLEMKGSIKATNDFSGRVLSVNELGDKDSFADDPESNSKTFDNSSCDTEAESYFLEYAISSKQQNRKRESTASQILDSSCTREPADQSEMPESFDSSIGYSSEIASSNQLSAKSISKGSRLPVASDNSSCCSGIKKLSFDVSPKASEAKSPYSLKLSGQMCPSSAPPSLQSRRTKIHLREQPLLLADHPFTEKVLSSYTLSSGPCQFANMSNYMPLSKVDSNVLDDKENIEQNDI
ncbi:hypothetical protein ACET3Z_009132 [Daucus carota]